MSFYDMQLTAIDGSPINLKQCRDMAMLIVNVASKCAFTPQYAGLEQLHRRYANDGFTVLGVPCNQSGEQEPGTPVEITAFCASYDVTFPLTSKLEVNGEDRHEVAVQLVDGRGVSQPVLRS